MMGGIIATRSCGADLRYRQGTETTFNPAIHNVPPAAPVYQHRGVPLSELQGRVPA